MTVSPQCDEGFAFRNGTDHLILADLQDPGFSMSGLAIYHSLKNDQESLPASPFLVTYQLLHTRRSIHFEREPSACVVIPQLSLARSGLRRARGLLDRGLKD